MLNNLYNQREIHELTLRLVKKNEKHSSLWECQSNHCCDPPAGHVLHIWWRNGRIQNYVEWNCYYWIDISILTDREKITVDMTRVNIFIIEEIFIKCKKNIKMQEWVDQLMIHMSEIVAIVILGTSQNNN